MKRAARHRKRTAPPGPCGVLWEMSRSKVTKSKRREEEEESMHQRDGSNEGYDLFPEDGDENNTENKNSGGSAGKKKRDDEQYDALTPPSWVAMQRSLDIITPYLPLSTRGDAQKRYGLLRPHLPRNCILLPEILSGRHDLKISDPDLYLCVWVDSIEERNSHHGIWTVGLKDETGMVIRAWMEPTFVRKELAKNQQAEEASSNKGVVRVGVVWMLANFSIIAINNNDNQETIERMLVVSGKHILRFWTPELDKAQIQPNEEEDSPEAQREYLDWMERRNSITVVDTENSDDKSLERECEEEEAEPREYSNFDRRRETRMVQSDNEMTNGSGVDLVGGSEHREGMTEMSALTMTTNDENAVLTSEHNTMNNELNHNFAATNGLNASTIQPASPLANRTVNRRGSSKTTVNISTQVDSNDNNSRGNAVYDENHGTSTISLQTQKSIQVTEKIDSKNSEHEQSSLHRGNHAARVSQHLGSQVLMQPHQSDNNNGIHSNRSDHCISSLQGLSQKKYSDERSAAKLQIQKDDNRRDDDRKESSPTCNEAVNINRSKGNRGSRHRTPLSPLRIPRSVLNTPDNTILEMLEDEEKRGDDSSDEDDEARTVIYEELSSCFRPIETARFGPVELSTRERLKGKESRFIGDGAGIGSNQNEDGANSDSSPLLSGRLSLGRHLLEPSNWAGVHMEALSESDSE